MVRIEVLDKRSAGLKSVVAQTARRALKALNRAELDLDIFLISSTRSRELNRRYRGQDKTASVLSFPPPPNWPEPRRSRPYLGEIYLTPGYLRRQGYSVQLLTIHGILHLLGFDHQTSAEFKKMEQAERDLARRLGLD